jgi:hypothetical protein
VDFAFGLAEERLQQRLEQLHGWSADSIRRRAAAEARLEAWRRRRAALRRCLTGDLAVPTWRCDCGELVRGAPMTCGSRVCPRCVSKLRKRAQAHVMDLLAVVDERRLQQHRRAARWRFVTLTSPSGPLFAPMKAMLGKAWGRLLRRKLWTKNVTAAVVAWETTHTRAGWHVHAHALVDSFLPRPQLVREWQLAVFAEVFADAQDGRRIWKGEPLTQETVRACKALLQRGRTLPAIRAGKLDGGGFFELAAAGDFAHVELADLVGKVQLLEVAGKAGELACCSLEDDLAPLTCDAYAIDQVRQLLAHVPTGVGVHISEPTGSRETIVRELSKYLAKDLAGAPTEEEAGEAALWGVAGTAERLAEFIVGTFRWRALRAYGDCYNAADELEAITCALSCPCCGALDLEWWGVSWCSQSEADALMRTRSRRDHAPGCGARASPT